MFVPPKNETKNQYSLQMLVIFQAQKLNQHTLKIKNQLQKQGEKTIFFKKNKPKDIERDETIK